MSSITPSPYNWSTKAIPGAFLLGIVPHGYVVTRLMMATQGAMSNTVPRTNLDVWKGKLSTDLWNHLTRARSAHMNSMEVFPLFAAAVIAGNVARLPAEDMNSMALSFLTARTLYIATYMTFKSEVISYARSGIWAWSISIPIMCLWGAGQSRAEL